MPKVSDAHLDARRRQITAAARALFADQGFARTTMADVVSASGLSNGAVYRYFPSKAELVLAVIADRDGLLEGLPPKESAAELIDRLVGYLEPNGAREHAKLVTQIWGDASVVPEIRQVVRDRHTRLQTQLAAILAKDRDDKGPAATNAQISQLCLSALVGASALVAAGIPVDFEGFRRLLLTLIPISS